MQEWGHTGESGAAGGADGAASRSLPLGDAIPAGLSSRDMIKHVIGETFRQRAH